MTRPITRRALIVDDTPSNSRLLGRFLQRLGWASTIVDGGERALQALAGDRFDLLMLDLRMPGMGGEAVCRTIRGQRGFQSLPVVAYTARALPAERDKLLAAGFDAVLLKPIAMDDVQAVLDHLVARLPHHRQGAESLGGAHSGGPGPC